MSETTTHSLNERLGVWATQWNGTPGFAAACTCGYACRAKATSTAALNTVDAHVRAKNTPQGYGPPLDPQVRERLEDDLQAQTEALDDAIAHCPNCKIAKTFATKKANKMDAENRWNDDQVNAYIRRAGCKVHKGMHGLLFRTSPISETYWAS